MAEGSTPPRRFAPPELISPQAAQFLTTPRRQVPRPPPIEDGPALRTWIAGLDAAALADFRAAARDLPAQVEAATIAGVPVFVGVPEVLADDVADRILLYLHPGALALWGGECVRCFAKIEAVGSGCRVVAVDYRNAPDHPYPEGLDDCVAVYRALAAQHGAQNIAIMGASGGGNLAAVLALKVRDAREPPPSSLVLLSPHLDLTEAGDTWTTNVGLDAALEGSAALWNRIYAVDHDMRDPYLSPLFADFAGGYPPTLLQAGTRDLLLSGTALMHRALRRHGLDAELHVWEAMPHGGFGGVAPEDQDVRVEANRFIRKHWRKTA
jgi:monoterpene epsilon-lactone hydrolase